MHREIPYGSSGAGFTNGERVVAQVTHLDGTPGDGEGHATWDTKAKGGGDFLTYWVVPYDDNVDETLMVTATGQRSGLVATTTFTNVNTVLEFVSIPASLLPGAPFSVTVRLTQGCGAGHNNAPLQNREILFFFTEGNCGVDMGQDPHATDMTDAAGEATVILVAPETVFGMRVKFRGEEKPNPCPMPGNSVCHPTDPNAAKRCVRLSNANACRDIPLAESCNISIACPPDITIECGESLDPAHTSAADVTANCNPFTVQYNDDVVSGDCAQGDVITRTWIAVDSAGNADTCTQIITVIDTTPPEFVVCAPSLTIQCADQAPTPGPADVTVTDNCDHEIIVTIARSDNGGSGSAGDPLVITDVYTAIDDCGNSAQCSRTITILDDVPPEALCPGDVTVNNDAGT